MTGTSTPQTKDSKPSVQLTNEGKKTFEKKEHQLIYRTFLDTLKDPEKQTQQEINKIQEKLQEKLSEQEKQKLLGDLKPLKELVPRLQNENEKKIFTFVFKNEGKIFNDVNQKIKSLSEENFSQFLLSVFKEIREQGLAREEKLNNDKIQQIVTKCVADIRGTEAKDSLIKFAGWPLGVKVDPKNFFGSFKDGLLEKVTFFGKDKKEEDEPPLSDEEMVKTFLSKIFLPALLSIASISIFGPTTLAIVAAVIGTIFAIKGGVEVLFSNNKKGTLYNPDSQDEKKKEGWDGKILDGINTILKTPVEKAKGSEQLISVPEKVSQENKRGNENSAQQPVPEKVSQKNEKSEQQPNHMLEKISVGPQAENTGRQPT